MPLTATNPVTTCRQVSKQLFDYFFASYRSPPYDTYATWEPPTFDEWNLTVAGGAFNREKVSQQTIEISTSIVLEALIGIDEVNFLFEVQFLLVLSWKDERINTKCTGAGRNGKVIRSDDRCAYYWQPQMPPIFPNQVSVSGNAPVEVLEDLGLFTFPGAHRLDCVSASPPSNCQSVVNTSVAYRMMRLRGSFGAAMEFRRFPYDQQQLEVIIRAPADLPRNSYIMIPKATVDPAILEQQAKSRASNPDDPGKDVIAGWRVVRMSASERSLIANESFWNASGFANEDGATTGDDPLFHLMESTTSAGHAQVLAASIPYYSTALSEASIVLHVCRIPSSYLYNFVILVTLIEMTALVSYLLLPSDIDPRVNLTLTVFLGVIFFQIMLSDLLPTTGYLTDMHYFTFFSTVLVVGVAASHVLIFWIQSKASKRAEFLRRIAVLRKSRRLTPAVIFVQRRVRLFLVRRAAYELHKRKEAYDLIGALSCPPAAARARTSCRVSPVRTSSAPGEPSVVPRLAASGPERKAAEYEKEKRKAGLLLDVWSYRAPRRKKALYGRLRKLLQQANETVEVFCVYILAYLNLVCALAFLGTYAAMTLMIFQGAPWNDRTHDCA